MDQSTQTPSADSAPSASPAPTPAPDNAGGTVITPDPPKPPVEAPMPDTPAPTATPAAANPTSAPTVPDATATPVATAAPAASPAPAPAAPPASPPVPATPAPEVPAAPSVPSPAPAATPAPASAPGGIKMPAKRILLVEDDDALASVYITRLQTEGFEVKRVPNGEDALATALQFKPDLILLDVMMPKVSGFDVLDILRNTPETSNIKVIMLTALSQDSDKERASQLGADDYLVKSQVVIADVVDRIRHHLNI